MSISPQSSFFVQVDDKQDPARDSFKGVDEQLVTQAAAAAGIRGDAYTDVVVSGVR